MAYGIVEKDFEDMGGGRYGSIRCRGLAEDDPMGGEFGRESHCGDNLIGALLELYRGRID